MFDDLLQPTYGQDNSPEDLTRVNQVILFYNQEDTDDFKRISKALMKKYWPEDFQAKGNISDLLLILLRNEEVNT